MRVELAARAVAVVAVDIAVVERLVAAERPACYLEKDWWWLVAVRQVALEFALVE